MGLPRTIFEINGNFYHKSQTFQPTLYLTSALSEFTWEFCNGGMLKTSVMFLPDGAKSLMIYSFDTIPECDVKTEGFVKTISRSTSRGMLRRDKSDWSQ